MGVVQKHAQNIYSGFHLERKLTSRDAGAPPARGARGAVGVWGGLAISPPQTVFRN
jgi:hypothetical protein